MMTDPTIEINGLKEIIDKFDKLPREVQRALRKTMDNSLLELQQNVVEMGYPPQRTNLVRPYKRTGTLGRSIGIGAKPTVYSITGSGSNIQGKFGTNLAYAKYVIGDETQAYMHKQWWWTMSVVKNRAQDKIKQLWDMTITSIKQKLGL
jgi:hypothetical protein